jgi:hypothetical protein
VSEVAAYFEQLTPPASGANHTALWQHYGSIMEKYARTNGIFLIILIRMSFVQ